METSELQYLHELLKYEKGEPIDDLLMTRLAGKVKIPSRSPGELVFDSGSFERRSKLIPKIGYIIPSTKIIKIIQSLNLPVVSVGCGTAYLESVLESHGINIIATDKYRIATRETKYHDFKSSLEYMDVESISGSDAVRKYPDHAVLCCFPCYEDDWAYQMLLSMRSGQILIYIGEGFGGCCANDMFFKERDQSFEPIGEHDIIDWYGLHSYLHIERKK